MPKIKKKKQTLAAAYHSDVISIETFNIRYYQYILKEMILEKV